MKSFSDSQLKPLGKAIADVLYSKDGWAILDKHGVEMWHMGGCFGLAHALKKWLVRGQVMALVKDNDSDTAEHFVLKIGDYYFDGRPKNAATKRRALLEYWRNEPGLSEAVLIPEKDAFVTDETACSLELLEDIVALLEKTISR